MKVITLNIIIITLVPLWVSQDMLTNCGFVDSGSNPDRGAIYCNFILTFNNNPIYKYDNEI